MRSGKNKKRFFFLSLNPNRSNYKVTPAAKFEGSLLEIFEPVQKLVNSWKNLLQYRRKCWRFVSEHNSRVPSSEKGCLLKLNQRCINLTTLCACPFQDLSTLSNAMFIDGMSPPWLVKWQHIKVNKTGMGLSRSKDVKRYKRPQGYQRGSFWQSSSTWALAVVAKACIIWQSSRFRKSGTVNSEWVTRRKALQFHSNKNWLCSFITLLKEKGVCEKPFHKLSYSYLQTPTVK